MCHATATVQVSYLDLEAREIWVEMLPLGHLIPSSIYMYIYKYTSAGRLTLTKLKHARGFRGVRQEHADAGHILRGSAAVCGHIHSCHTAKYKVAEWYLSCLRYNKLN